MPGLDQTGPLGAGPRTGRGLGRCGNVAESRGVGRGGRPFGGGRGFCFGGGRGRRPWGFFRGVAPSSSSDEVNELREQLAAAHDQIASLKARLDEWERKKTGE